MAFSVAGGMKPGMIIDVENRFYRLLIVGKEKLTWAEDDLDDELLDIANKLEIEQQALQERLLKQQQQKQVFEAVSSQLMSTIIDSMQHQFDSVEPLLAHSTVSSQQWLLLELLQSSKLDLNRLKMVLDNISGLSRDLVNLVNSPAFRQSRAQSTEVQVSDLKLVLNYIGIEQLKLLIPYYCMRSWLPKKNTSILWMTRKLWRFANVAAIASKALAEFHQRETSLIYTATLTNLMGTTVVLGNCAQVFESIRGQWLREASDSRDKAVYDAVLATEFPAHQVFENVLTHGSKLNWKILEHFEFGNFKLSKMLHELDQTLEFNKLCIDSALAMKATIYAKTLLMEEQQQLSPQEKKLMFDYYEFSEEELVHLKGQNYRKQDIL
ncbi:MAG: HDOD domain-containing protein [Shewanella sp.]|nr:HDOD domain-containing protein [Shewanella sp.]